METAAIQRAGKPGVTRTLGDRGALGQPGTPNTRNTLSIPNTPNTLSSAVDGVAAVRSSEIVADHDRCYLAVLSRDSRFDGTFFTAVRTTGIYCRPSCPTPVLPKARNVDFYPSAAAAQRAGFRACKRCRPDATPGSPEWNSRADLVGRALRLIADGVIDRVGVGGLANQLAVSERHLVRLLQSEVGAPPLALARAQRAQTARVLIETTELPLGQVAFASGFASIRQFNDTIREVFASSPTDLRAAHAKRRLGLGSGRSTITVRLPVRQPFAFAPLLRFLEMRALPGIETIRFVESNLLQTKGSPPSSGVTTIPVPFLTPVADVRPKDAERAPSNNAATYARSLFLPNGPAVVELLLSDDGVLATFHLSDLADLQAGIARCRRLLDLDADPLVIDHALAADPSLAPLVKATPGRRSPGAVDPHELCVRAVLGQQVSVAAARTLAARLVDRFGAPSPFGVDGITRMFPLDSVMAEQDPATIGIPMARARALVGFSDALATGKISLDAGVDREEAVKAMEELPGIGPWTASYVCMRSLSDPDVFLATDLAVRQGAARVNLPSEQKPLDAHAQAWRPWRSYATHHLWGSLSMDLHWLQSQLPKATE
jgi:AraC family transcriptional regulator, regulatory protein of adaptative response / DNA-3-methyladenine glycosylase II